MLLMPWRSGAGHIFDVIDWESEAARAPSAVHSEAISKAGAAYDDAGTRKDVNAALEARQRLHAATRVNCFGPVPWKSEAKKAPKALGERIAALGELYDAARASERWDDAHMYLGEYVEATFQAKKL